ncbi:MAG TPA: tetratricopeptide repeat protein [Gemmatimonadaceae bacterium]|nr:tetratricopeptide repeat protein [Gemmatimonadaceae bacterium]
MSVAPRPDDRLDSWKAIAAYLERGVRTVRRWEREENLPVHRHVHRVLGSVYAFRSEIDAWQRRRRASIEPTTNGSAAAGAEVESIAVLPFANASADSENAYFADGLTDEITADLSRLRALRVISRTSAAAVGGRAPKDARSIARALGVRYLLEGSVRRADDRLRITARLVDARTDTQIWAAKFDGVLADVFAFQEQIARQIVDALALRLTTDEDRRLAERPIENAHAYECYLRARHQGWRWRKDAIDQAVQLLHNGLAVVGDNARLLTALGVAHMQYREAGVDLDQRHLAEAERCAEKVFALEPKSAAGFRLRGWIHYSRAEVQEAVRDLESSLAEEPNDPDTLLLLSNCLLISGQLAAARPLIERLVRIDPLTPLTQCMPAWAAMAGGDFAAAVAPYRKMYDMDPGNPMARLFYVLVLLYDAQSGARTEPPDVSRVDAVLDGFSADVRDTPPAWLARFLATAVTTRDRDALPPLTAEMDAVARSSDVLARMLAGGYAIVGAVDEAVTWLEVAVARGFINYPFLAMHDPLLEPARRTPAFERLMADVRRRWEAFVV